MTLPLSGFILFNTLSFFTLGDSMSMTTLPLVYFLSKIIVSPEVSSKYIISNLCLNVKWSLYSFHKNL